jgi:putative endonuclease
MSADSYYVYILTNKWNNVLYTGVTNNLGRRMLEHGQNNPRSFVSRYKLFKLVYYEEFSSRLDAILREKQIKGGSRQKKIDLIERSNPTWSNLFSFS